MSAAMPASVYLSLPEQPDPNRVERMETCRSSDLLRKGLGRRKWEL